MMVSLYAGYSCYDLYIFNYGLFAGAILTGIDITPKSIELTKKNLELHGYHSDLLVADAEKLAI